MATRTISVVGGNYNAVGTWDEGVVPTSSDDVVARAGGDSGQLTVNVASAALTVNFTNYSNTLTMNAGLTVSGSVTLVSAMTISGSSGLTVNATGTLTSNTKTWPNALTLSGTTPTFTFADNWDVNGTLTLGGTTSAIVLTGSQINASAAITVSLTTANCSGTTVIVFDGGNQTITSSMTSGRWSNNITINSTGTITFATGIKYSGVMTHTLGRLAGLFVYTPATVAQTFVS